MKSSICVIVILISLLQSINAFFFGASTIRNFNINIKTCSNTHLFMSDKTVKGKSSFMDVLSGNNCNNYYCTACDITVYIINITIVTIFANTMVSKYDGIIISIAFLLYDY